MSKLWAITPYFNPAGFSRREENYRIFRENLSLPQAAIELSFDGRFHLKPSDADLLIQVTSEDVMWHKESLLNRLIRELPQECEAVCWIDCDVVFEVKDLAERVLETLRQYSWVQMYDHRFNLKQDETLEDVFGKRSSFDAGRYVPSVSYRRVTGSGSEEDFRNTDSPIIQKSTIGLAWASSREVLDKHGLYDGSILGGADRAMACAALGRFEFAEEALLMSPIRMRHFLQWAQPFYETIQGAIGYVPGDVYHLWHGEYHNRQYNERQEILNRHDFDPGLDIRRNHEGLLEWSTGKSEMHNEVADYFVSRKEDG